MLNCVPLGRREGRRRGDSDRPGDGARGRRARRRRTRVSEIDADAAGARAGLRLPPWRCGAGARPCSPAARRRRSAPSRCRRSWRGSGSPSTSARALPLDLELRRRGRGARSASATTSHGGRPVILTLNYYRCPMLCTLVLNGLVDGLQRARVDARASSSRSSRCQHRPDARRRRWRRLKKQNYLEELRPARRGRPAGTS